MEVIKNECLPDSIKMGDYFLKFEKDENLEAFYVQKAAKELRENPTLKEESLKELKKLISEDSDLYIPLDDEDIDLYLTAFLRICKFYVHSAFEKMKNLFQCRMKYPEYFSQIMPITEEKIFRQNLLTILPERDQYGRRIVVLQLGSKWKPNNCSLTEIVRGVMLIIEGAMLEPRTQISGSVLIVDLEGMNFQHVLQFSPSFAKMLLDWVQDLLPIRLKAVHLVKQSYVFDMGYAVFKPFIREKLRKRIFFHGRNQVSLLKHIHAKYVPIRFGGMMDVSLDEGLSQWKLFCMYNHRYEQTCKYGFKQLSTNEKNKK